MFMVVSETLSYHWCFNCKQREEFLKAQNDKVVFTFDSTMNADRLSALSILSIERDYVQKLNFEDIIADFTSAKARKVQF